MQTYKKKGRIWKKLTRDRKKRTPPKILPKIDCIKEGKRIFSIQRVIKNTPPESTKGVDPPENPMIDFTFTNYQKDIVDEYNVHFETKLKNFIELIELVLPIPSLSRNQGGIIKS